MKNNTFLRVSLLLTTLPTLANTPPAAVVPPPSNALEFVANRHQWEKPVLFAADVPGGRLFLERGRLVQARYDVAAVEAVHDRALSADAPIKAHAYSVTFVGANAQASVRGEEQRSAHTNFFLGNDPKKWASNVPAYSAVRYQALYPGTDLRLYSHNNQVEYDFELAPGADASRLRLRYDGQQSLRLEGGALRVGTSVGTVVEQRPYAYQLRDGRREPVACEYVLSAQHTVSFALPQGYDHHRPLVIDPVLVYSSYSGSQAENYSYSSTYDVQGNLYNGGIAFSLGFPATMGAYSTTFAGSQDMAIMKFNPSANSGPASLLYATYLGGTAAEQPHSLLVDSGGNLLIFGSTSSPDYATSAGAYDTSFNGGSDIVVTRLNATGSALLASTFIGGSAIDGQLPVRGASDLSKNLNDSYRGDLALDQAGNVYVASNTQSSNFPRIGGVQSAKSGPCDAVVCKLTPALGGLQWSVFLGGSNLDAAYAIQVDSLNNVFVCGGTASVNFPGTSGGLHPTYGGGTTDGFVSRIAASGMLVQSTYLGTSGYDQAYFLQLDRQGQVYIFGQTDGTYPVSTGVYSNPNSLQFIHKMRPTLTSDWWSTVVGNGRVNSPETNLPFPTNISPTAFLVDNCNQILLAGYGVNINNMPITSNAIQMTPSKPNTIDSFLDGDLYIMQLSANAGRLVYGTYFGNGTIHTHGTASRFDKFGVIYQSVCVAGGMSNSGSGPIIITPNAWAQTPGWTNRNALSFKLDVLKLNAGFIPTTTATDTVRRVELCAPAQFYFKRIAASGSNLLWDFGNGQTSTLTTNPAVSYPNPGKYPVRLTVFDSNSCGSTTTTVDTVTVYAVPQPQIQAVQPICAGASATLTATNLTPNLPNIVYTWTAPGQPTLTGPSVQVSPTATTRYIVTAASAAGGCVGTDTVTVRVLPQQALNAAFVPALTVGSLVRAASQCAPAKFYFTRPIVAGATVSWDFGNGQTAMLVNNATATYSMPGKYAVRLTVLGTNTCSPSVTTVDTVTVLAVPQPQVAVSSRQSVCAGSTATLTATNLTPNMPNVTYTWTAPGQPALTGASVTVSPSATIKYTVTASTAGGCAATDTVTVRVLAPLVTSAGPARTICPGAATTLSATDAGAGATYTWTAPGQPTLTGRTVTVNPPASTDYRVQVRTAAGCQASASVRVEVVAAPHLSVAVGAPTLVNGPVVFVNTSTGATGYRWDFGDGTTSTEPSPSHVYNTASAVPFRVRLTATYGPGCEASTVLEVPVHSLDVPNIITPNHDGKNDTFRPFVTTEQVDIQIFNRWGRLVFEQWAYANDWSGDDVPAGVYYYRLVSASGASWKGWLEVVK